MDYEIQKNQIQKVFIKLESEGKQVLYLFFSEMGTINRMGDGSNEGISRFFMGQTEDPVFQDFMEEFPAELLSLAGRYTFPNPQGEICFLEITLEGEEINTGFAFTYGADSEGPPEEIFELVNLALDLSDPWYEDQLNQKKRN
ncbi:MAG: hypothetical protein KDE26_13195 [Bacteroidetes bacterium]|nr:hypothetical protein [Bacteroidota bacterium]